MIIVYPGQTNVLRMPLVSKTTGNPITAGTVAFYLKAQTGVHAGKWWDGSAWSATEASAGAASNSGDSGWELSLGAGVWASWVHYNFYAIESGSLHLPVDKDIMCRMRF